MSEDYQEIEGRIRKRWEKDVSKPHLKGKLSFEESLHMLINCCMTCPPDEFSENVSRLFYALPEPYKDEELWEELDKATKKVEVTTPVRCCGVPVKASALRPKVETVEQTDFHILFNAILNCVHRRNLLIPAERVEVATEEK